MRTSVSYKSNRNEVHFCKYYVVWCPKYRRRVLEGDVAAHPPVILYQAADELRADIIELEIMPDHVHLLIKQYIENQKQVHK